MVDNCYTVYQTSQADSTAVIFRRVAKARRARGKRLNTTILLFLLQDGITNGAIYALLGLALVLVFAVTRVIQPFGRFVSVER